MKLNAPGDKPRGESGVYAFVVDNKTLWKITVAVILLISAFSGYWQQVEWPVRRQPSYPRFAGVKNTSTTVPSATLAANPLDAEWNSLQEMIAWPSPKSPYTFETSTDPRTSYFEILNEGELHVGDTLRIGIHAADHRGQAKRYGGDYFRFKIYSNKLKAGAFGSVRDHENGEYTASVTLFWVGDVQIDVRLIHSSETVELLRRLRDSAPDKVYFHGHFEQAGAPSETTECNLFTPQQGREVCEYPDRPTGEVWYCVKPKSLPCESLRYHSMGNYKTVVTKGEQNFFGGAVTNVNIKGHSSQTNVLPLVNSTFNPGSGLGPCKPGSPLPSPSGYYINDKWVSLACKTWDFGNPADMSACLNGKSVYMFGDSTMRQWFEYFTQKIPGMQIIDVHSPKQMGPLLATGMGGKTFLAYRCHGFPLRSLKGSVAAMHYIANEIDGIPGGKDTIVAFTVWAHFTSYPVIYYVKRMRNIRASIVRLLARSPETLVFIKTANTSYKSVFGSDWLAKQLDRVMRQMMSGLRVVVVDVWEMTAAHRFPDQIHPQAVIIQNELSLVLSYVCPK